MAVSKKPLHHRAVQDLDLSTPQARAAYQAQRLALEVGRTIRHERKVAQLTQIQLAVKASIDQADLSRLETGQGVRGATIGFIERVAHALGREVVIRFVDSAHEADSSGLNLP
jgi:ribosome-binding protein aMBF1 (putative translation factor)